MPRSDKPKLAALRSITPGWDPQIWNDWIPKTARPSLAMLRDEILDRARRLCMEVVPRPSQWPGPKCISWLAANADVEDESRPDENQDVMVQNADTSAPRVVWVSSRHVPLLVNCIVATKHSFLERDQTATRADQDARDCDRYWRELAEVFMTDQVELQRLHDVVLDEVDFNETTLSAERRDYVADAASLKKKFRELRTALMKALSNHELSGNGDGGPLSEADRASQMTVYSSNFKDFLEGKEHLHYAYAVLVQHGLLDSVSDAMPEEARAGSDLKRPAAAAGSMPRDNQRRRLNDLDTRWEMLNAPIVIQKSPDELRILSAQAAEAEVKTGEALMELMAERRRILNALEGPTDEFETNIFRSRIAVIEQKLLAMKENSSAAQVRSAPGEDGDGDITSSHPSLPCLDDREGNSASIGVSTETEGGSM